MSSALLIHIYNTTNKLKITLKYDTMNITETCQVSGSNQANKSSAVGHCWLDIGFRYRTNVSSDVRPVRQVDLISGPLESKQGKGSKSSGF